MVNKEFVYQTVKTLFLITNLVYMHINKMNKDNFNVLANVNMVIIINSMNNYHNKNNKYMFVVNNVKMNNIINNLKILTITYVWIHVKKIIMYKMVHVVVNLIV